MLVVVIKQKNPGVHLPVVLVLKRLRILTAPVSQTSFLAESYIAPNYRHSAANYLPLKEFCRSD